MSVSSENQITELITKIFDKTVSTIQEGKKSGQLKPQKLAFFKWSVDNFEYTDKGVISHSATGNEIEKEDWTIAIHQIYEYIQSLDISHNLKTHLDTLSSNHKSSKFDEFLRNFIHHYIYDDIKSDDLENIKNAIIDELNDKPFNCGARIEIIGLVIAVPTIDLHNGVVIRQTQKSDIEKEYPSYDLSRSEFGLHPSMIINLSMIAKNPIDIQNKIREIETILSLFTVGSISIKEYRLTSKTFSPSFTARGFTDARIYPQIMGLIKENDVDRLRLFWNEVKDRIGIFTSFGEKSTFRHIAYQRYHDAVSNAGQVERAISDCMMGFESIFLRDNDEQQELSYRLRLRTARFFGILGFDPFKIKKMVNEAYSIRSRFVHGGILDYERTEELNEKYVSLKEFLTKLVDLLRIAIVIMLVTDIGKPRMIDTIDNSFLSKEHEDTLRGLLIRHKELISA